ncbi:MAG: RluA family pseudouridine synthase [Lachnospiraceae bacterium]|nr:RluA family pseudouridine synthase [Lachnospiraceae bacterium]
MEKKVSGRVSQEDNNLKLETFLKTRLHLTKNEISRAKFLENGICVNGKRQKIDTRVKSGDLVEVLLETKHETSQNLRDSSKSISVLYEDTDVIVVNKPAGISVHPAGKNDSDTLANRLAYYLRNKGEDSVIRIFGRLDKDTSGVVLAVKNRAAATRLELQREKHILFKNYLAVVQGIPSPAKGRINIPLSPDPQNRKQVCADPNGKPAVTCYETVAVNNDHALIRLRLETGRMHQIRIHMASIGCPLLGDPLYGNKTVSEIKRTALHAQMIHFLQPFTEKEIQVTAPVPEDIRLIFHPEIL